MRDGDFFCTHVINGGCYKTGKKDTAISVFFFFPSPCPVYDCFWLC